MTKILLDAIFIPALSHMTKNMPVIQKIPAYQNHWEVISSFQDVYRQTYYHTKDISDLISMVTETMLTSSGNLYYVGSASSGCIGNPNSNVFSNH